MAIVIVINIVMFFSCSSIKYINYTIDDGFLVTAGITKDKVPFVIKIFFSFDYKVEKEKNNRFAAEKITEEVSIEIRNYIYNSLPLYTTNQIYEYLDMEENDLLTGLIKFLETHEKFKNVKINKIVMRVEGSAQ